MKVLGIGNAIVDVICKVDENFISDNNLSKGNMKLIFDEKEFQNLMSNLKIEKTISGGSVANSIVGLSQQGNEVGFIGKVAMDSLGEKYEMSLRDDLSLIAIQGPRAVNILEKVINGISKLNFMNGSYFNYLNENIYITRSGYTGEDGFEISIKNKDTEVFVEKLINGGAKLIGLGARDTLRLEAGLCLYGHDMDIKKSPVEANLKWAISKKRIISGGFIGFEKIKSQLEKGVNKVRVGIKPEGRIIAREKTAIFSESNKNIGEITSGTFGPSVQAPVAMGYIDNSFSKKNTKIFLEVRGKKYPASISNLPFYKKNYVKGANK